ncbi:hypothetical protein V1L52_02875 [Treponema sp. HNW]|uniref:hypothetical protein n=1 Tax=Treponema sp. HNW TaxID=3116654 RepID=UPI003D0BC851
MQPDMLLHCIKLVLGGIAAFLAIFLWSKTREAAWIAVIAGTVTSYAGLVYNVLIVFGITVEKSAVPSIAGISLITLLFTVIPQLFFIAGFIIALVSRRRI